MLADLANLDCCGAGKCVRLGSLTYKSLCKIPLPRARYFARSLVSQRISLPLFRPLSFPVFRNQLPRTNRNILGLGIWFLIHEVDPFNSFPQSL